MKVDWSDPTFDFAPWPFSREVLKLAVLNWQGVVKRGGQAKVGCNRV
jgi:hypothetical protein